MSGYAIAATWLVVVTLALVLASALLKRADDREQQNPESIREWLGLDDSEQP